MWVLVQVLKKFKKSRSSKKEFGLCSWVRLSCTVDLTVATVGLPDLAAGEDGLGERRVIAM